MFRETERWEERQRYKDRGENKNTEKHRRMESSKKQRQKQIEKCIPGGCLRQRLLGDGVWGESKLM